MLILWDLNWWQHMQVWKDDLPMIIWDTLLTVFFIVLLFLYLFKWKWEGVKRFFHIKINNRIINTLLAWIFSALFICFIVDGIYYTTMYWIAYSHIKSF